ncbi:hypothetical protein HDU91_002235 [Kappamyces sp. JEL0680]|nr:hypothetical protein HDU91_002235 [Kappamyces sp. JEL0680]
MDKTHDIKHYLDSQDFEKRTPSLKLSCLDIRSDGSEEGVPTEKKSALVTLFEARPKIPSSANFYVLKISGIAWDTTISEIVDFLYPAKIPRSHESPYFTECVHITSNVAFVEFPNRNEAMKALHSKSSRRTWRLHNRNVTVSESSQDQLFEALFPNMRIIDNGPEISKGVVFLIRETKSSSMLQTSIRAYETVISIVSKVPWHKPEEMATLQRDHLFELMKLSVDALMTVSRPLEHRELLLRLIRAGLCVPLFTEKQKIMLLNAAGLTCPIELDIYLYVPEVERPSFSIPKNESPATSKEYYDTGLSPASTLVGFQSELGWLTAESEYERVIQALKHKVEEADKLVQILRREHQDLAVRHHELLYNYDTLQTEHAQLKAAASIRRSSSATEDRNHPWLSERI